jgi:DNA end-binding protein Ku
MPRSLADLSLSFGLVSIPVKIYPATESKGGAPTFNFLHATCGSRLRQQYVCIKEDVVVERSEMVKGFEFAKDQYVTFTPEELKLLQEPATHSVDIVAFVPDDAIDPIYYDKAYYLAPDKRGDRPYRLLLEGMLKTGRVALARWAWRGKSYTVQVRPSPEGGLVLQQLLYADEVRSMKDLSLPETEVKKAELDLAISLIEQISQDSYDPTEYKDEEKERVEAAVEEKVQGHEITVAEEPQHGGGQVIDLMAALRASLGKKGAPARAAAEEAEEEEEKDQASARKTPRHASKSESKTTAKAPARTAAKTAAKGPARAPAKKAARKTRAA